ncbi:hypothetical protein EC973_004891 [Apophysomyces ossiformis]|uniref:RGS domain-containing protein n=1 Tax=Apophysomyces ossiformis TaxID=679940 RepID=A0A8H7BWR6_9FUNG|nr:hypothetical protein EC973_004891 [Apophysomyces ossiformis]
MKTRFVQMNKVERATYQNDAQYRWFIKHRHGTISNQVSTAYVVGLIALIVVCVAGEISSTRTKGSHCKFQWADYLLAAFNGMFFLFIAPIIVWSVRGYKDAHGIRTEMLVDVGVGIPCFAIFIFWMVRFDQPTDSLDEYLYRVFLSENWSVFFMTACYVMSVVVPLSSTLSVHFLRDLPTSRPTIDDTLESLHGLNERHRRLHEQPTIHVGDNTLDFPLELTAESLKNALVYKGTLLRLRTLAIQDFSSENVLFYENYLKLADKVKLQIKQARRLSAESKPESDSTLSSAEKAELLTTPIEGPLLDDFIEFYQSFIAEEAPLQVNISYKARKGLDDIFRPLTGYKETTSTWDPSQAFGMSEENVNKLSKVHPQAAARVRRHEKPAEQQAQFPNRRETPVVTLEVFEAAQKETFWNIFASVFPKLVADYKEAERISQDL